MNVLTFLLLLVSPVWAIWPVPKYYTNGSSTLWILPNVTFTYEGYNIGAVDYSQSKRAYNKRSTTSNLTDEDAVHVAAQNAIYTIFNQSIIPWKLYPRNTLPQIEPSGNGTKTYIKHLAITQTAPADSTAFNTYDGQVDESYSLLVEKNGTATLAASTTIGILRGLQTFTQLFYTLSTGNGVYTNLAPVNITDSPKFAHRGVLLDVSRNWYPASDLKRTIDGLAYNKFNRLHLHMTDSQSWPMDITTYPELSAKGAYLKGFSYSPAVLEDIQNYAATLGIEVIIEIDMPGHMGSIALSHPDLITAYDAQPWSTYCAEPPCGQLKLNSSDATQFIENVLKDLLPRVTPYTGYFHTGGDELNVNAYLLDDTVQSNDSAVIQPLLQKFVNTIHDQVRDAGLEPMVWEEMLVTWNLTLGQDVTVQSWGAVAGSLDTITAAGHKAIASDYNFWYLDCGKGQWLDFSPESYATYYPFNDYCSPVKNWRLVYSFDPVGGLSDEQAALVVGGEVALWSEQTDPINLDDMLWPRASAAGEVLWSGRQDLQGNNRTFFDASPRLAEFRERLLARGINSGPVQMVFCTQANPEECSL